MRVYVDAQLSEIESGLNARSEALRLIGHGYDKESALESLQKAAIAWCNGLQRAGRLEDVVRRKGLRTEPDDRLLVTLVQNT